MAITDTVKTPEQVDWLTDDGRLPVHTLTVPLPGIDMVDGDVKVFGVHEWSKRIQQFEDLGFSVRQLVIVPDPGDHPDAMVVLEYQTDAAFIDGVAGVAGVLVEILRLLEARLN